MKNIKIAVSESRMFAEQAKQLASQLNLPIIELADQSVDYLLVLTQTHLQLHKNNSKTKPVYVDFLSNKIMHRNQFGGGKRQLIARAMGIKNQSLPTIIDATAGLGIDAQILANLGCKVQMLERSAIMAALLQDGLNRARKEPQFNHLQLDLIAADAKEYLLTLQRPQYPDVIYIDPMFPARAKTALNKVEMRILREIVGEDMDVPQLLQIAVKRAKKRVVVKLPRLAHIIAGIVEPDIKYIGKSCRFDVYLTTQTQQV